MEDEVIEIPGPPSRPAEIPSGATANAGNKPGTLNYRSAVMKNIKTVSPVKNNSRPASNFIRPAPSAPLTISLQRNSPAQRIQPVPVPPVVALPAPVDALLRALITSIRSLPNESNIFPDSIRALIEPAAAALGISNPTVPPILPQMKPNSSVQALKLSPGSLKNPRPALV
jgi:hypothetical protein